MRENVKREDLTHHALRFTPPCKNGQRDGPETAAPHANARASRFNAREGLVTLDSGSGLRIRIGIRPAHGGRDDQGGVQCSVFSVQLTPRPLRAPR